MSKLFKKNLGELILYLSAVSTLGSLFFSEILKLPPCVLCWYQRVCMYPIAIIAAVCIWKKDKNLPYFVLPLSLVGTVISIYHNLLYYKIIPESLAPCVNGISCTTKQLDIFGFLTIPLMALIAFIALDLLTIYYYRLHKTQ